MTSKYWNKSKKFPLKNLNYKFFLKILKVIKYKTNWINEHKFNVFDAGEIHSEIKYLSTVKTKIIPPLIYVILNN